MNDIKLRGTPYLVLNTGGRISSNSLFFNTPWAFGTLIQILSELIFPTSVNVIVEHHELRPGPLEGPLLGLHSLRGEHPHPPRGGLLPAAVVGGVLDEVDEPVVELLLVLEGEQPRDLLVGDAQVAVV